MKTPAKPLHMLHMLEKCYRQAVLGTGLRQPLLVTPGISCHYGYQCSSTEYPGNIKQQIVCTLAKEGEMSSPEC